MFFTRKPFFLYMNDDFSILQYASGRVMPFVDSKYDHASGMDLDSDSTCVKHPWGRFSRNDQRFRRYFPGVGLFRRIGTPRIVTARLRIEKVFLRSWWVRRGSFPLVSRRLSRTLASGNAFAREAASAASSRTRAMRSSVCLRFLAPPIRREQIETPRFHGGFSFVHGGFAGARTRDLGLKRALLYRLSYEPALRGCG